jgi:Flp pilus assembly protein TadD
LTEFGASQEIIRKLTLIDPHNADWQRDLAFTYNSIGEVLQAQDHIATALDEFHKYSQTMENVAASDPANTVWQREAADARQPIAELLVKQKQFKEALSEFRKYYTAMNKLAAGDPTNAAVQVVAAAACSQVALVNMMLKDRGDYDEAAHMAQQGLALLAGVEKRGTPPPQSVEIRKKLEWLKRSLPNPAP